MKKMLLISAIMLLILSGSVYAQNVGVTDKSGGITPATTLHVHKNANTGNVLQITTGNTGETSTDGLVIKRDASSFGIVSQESDTINLGGSTAPGSHTSIEPDGTLVYKGEATVWDDMLVYPGLTNVSQSTPPTYVPFRKDAAGTSQGVTLLGFDKATEEEVYFQVQMPHSYRVGTTVYPHIHWTTTAATPTRGTADVVWGLEYTIQSIGGTFSTTSTITGKDIVASITVSGTHQHLITPLTSISGTGLGISTILVCRLYRKAQDTSDTFTEDALLLGFDIHYEKDTDGSRTQFDK